ncbi:MAG: Ig-like domain repeat protein, partial [Ornithinibacter sp.]
TSSTSGNVAITVTAAPPVQGTTTTALAMAPSTATAVAPAARTLTATVTGAGAAGTVQFFNGATSLGTATVAAGSASLSLSNIAEGSYSYHAVFNPTNAALFTSSTSGNVALTVTAAPPVQVTTTTALAMTPSTATATAPAARTLTATVTGAGAAGTVQFFNGPTSLGTATLAAGSATLSLTNIPVGSYSYHALFTPTNAALFTSSTSANVALTVTVTVPPSPSPASINRLSEYEGHVGDRVTITGTGFGTPGVVKFGSATAKAVSWSTTRIVVIVPPANAVSLPSRYEHLRLRWYAHEYKVLVTVTPKGAAASNGVRFEMKWRATRGHIED